MKGVLCGLVWAVAGALPAAETLPQEGWAVLPVEEYRALHAAAHPAAPQHPSLPADATITRLDYDLRLAGDSAVGETRMTLDVLKDGWVTVPVPSGLLVREARIDGRPTALVAGTPPAVLLRKPGRAVVTLETAVPVAASSGTETLRLPASSAALTHLRLVLPRRGLEPSVTGGLLGEKSEGGQETRLVAYGKSGEGLVLSWRARREDHRATLPLRLRGALSELVSLGEDTTHVTAHVELEVVQGALPALRIPIPEGLTVNQVTGAAVGAWSLAGGALEVRFFEPLTGSSRFVVAAEARLPREGSISVPLLRLDTAERETGGVAVEVLGAGEIEETAETPRGLEPADPADLGAVVAGRVSPSLVAFRYRPQGGSAPRRLAVAVRRFTPEAVLLANVEEARHDLLATEEGKTLVRARWAVRNNVKSFLGVKLPEGAVLWSASLAGRPVRPGTSPDGTIVLPLEKGRAGEDAPAFLVEIVYLTHAAAWPKEGTTELRLPAIDLPISRTALLLQLSPGYDAAIEPGVFRERAFERASSAAFSNPAGERVAEAPQSLQAQVELKMEIGRAKEADLSGLIEQYQKQSRAGTARGVVPLRFDFPSVGGFRFLTAALTPEGQAPAIGLKLRRHKGGRS